MFYFELCFTPMFDFKLSNAGVRKNNSSTTTGDSLTGQGADFIQEQKNKEQKSLLPPGWVYIPDSEKKSET